MLFLLAAIVSSAIMALIFKYSENREGNRYVLTTVNYITAVAVSLSLWLLEPASEVRPSSVSEMWQQLGGIFWDGGQLSGDASLTWSLILGIPSGLMLFLGLIFYQIAVRDAGVSLAGAFAKLGILVPMVLSLLLWRELPTVWQWFGIVLAMAAIITVSKPRGGGKVLARLPLLLLFLTVGMADFSNKLFQKLSIMEHKSLFLVASFASALLLSLIPHLGRRRGFSRRDVVLGIAVGVPNQLASYFLILALGHFPAVVAFPVFSAGTITFIFLAGHFFFGERLSPKEKLAIVFILPALILMNL